jgi:hypothetical protein
MSRLYLYAIADGPAETLQAGSGLDGRAPFGIGYQEIIAVVGASDVGEVERALPNLLAHEAVAESLLEGRAILPARFGTVLAGEEAVRALLTRRHARFVADLNRVRGCVELGVRVLWEEPAAEEEAKPASPAAVKVSGREYLLARLEQERRQTAERQRATALAGEIHVGLTPLARDSAWHVLQTPRMLLTGAYLVNREEAATFKAGVEALRGKYPTLQFMCTGPWPAYSFVTADASAGN